MCHVHCNRFAKCLFKKFDWILHLMHCAAAIDVAAVVVVLLLYCMHFCGLFDCCLNGNIACHSRLRHFDDDKSKCDAGKKRSLKLKLKLCHFVV